MYRKLIACIFLTVIIAGCATTSDPRQGGLFGGIAGLSSGAYEKRVQQREDELTHQRKYNENLKEGSISLSHEAQIKETELYTEQQRMKAMEGNLSKLQADVDQLKAKSEKQKREISVLKRKIKDARQRLKSNQIALNTLEHSGGIATDPDRYRVLEKERNRLTEEYKKLFEYYKDIANAAK